MPSPNTRQQLSLQDGSEWNLGTLNDSYTTSPYTSPLLPGDDDQERVTTTTFAPPGQDSEGEGVLEPDGPGDNITITIPPGQVRRESSATSCTDSEIGILPVEGLHKKVTEFAAVAFVTLGVVLTILLLVWLIKLVHR